MEKTKKILITGARGMLGSVLCKTLGSLFAVTAIDKEECDIADSKAVKNFFDTNTFDAIVHCAAYTGVDKAEGEAEQAFLLNAQGTKNILDNICTRNSLFIYISTDYVFDGAKETPYTEEDTPHPLNVYGTTKLGGERFAQAYPHHVIIRTSWLFGPGGNNFVNTILKLASEKDTLSVVSDQRGSPTYTVDLANAIREILDIRFRRGLTCGIYHVTNSGTCSWCEFAQYIISRAGLRIEVRAVASEYIRRKARRPKNSVLSNEKFYGLTGYYLPDWREAVKEYIKRNMHN